MVPSAMGNAAAMAVANQIVAATSSIASAAAAGVKNKNNTFGDILISRGHATLHLAVSVGRYEIFLKLQTASRITAPAQLSATGLPCIRPCLYTIPVGRLT